ncbi:MAG: Electron transfer flavoprotein-ubiquinone oxidoreductase, partial [uncultured Solirubrobacteraceae bacterium]
KIPTPPPFKNHGNEVVSVAALARFQQRTAEEAGAYVLTETSASQLLVEDGRVVGVRTGDKGRDREGGEKGNFEPGSDVTAKAVVLAEGCWGHLTGAAIKEFELGKGHEPQVWELGVKEVWKVPKPLDRIIHTIGPWPLKLSSKYGQIGGTWLYPMKDEKTGDDLVSIGFVIDLEYADATTSAHDLLQLFKMHPLVRGILEGGERVAWGAKALPGGGYWSMPKLTMPGALLVGDAGGMVDTVALKGVHHSIKSGHLAAEAIYAALKAGSTDFSPYEDAIESSSVGKELYQVRNTRQPFQKGFIQGGPLVNLSIATKGKLPPGRWSWHRNDAQEMFVGNTRDAYPKPDGKYTFDKLSSVFITGNATRDDAPNHIRVQKRVPRVVAETWQYMCPAGVYEIPEDAEGEHVDVVVNYTNCVQCGAITAKGGRLTTPEGGDGPLYQIT